MSTTAKAQRKQKTVKEVQKKAPTSLKKTAQKETYDNPTPAGEKPTLDEFPNAYSPARVECAWYSWWNNNHFFHPRGNGKPYVIVLPPPNVTGELHLGHALTTSIEDALVRYHRMIGDQALWIPGTDHAGIATQVRVEKKLQLEKGLRRKDMTREQFLEAAHEWNRVNGGRINEQLKFMGSSLDWENYFFTLDEARNEGVNECFIRLFNKGKIFRSERLVNWDCALQTAISDAEVEYMTLSGRTQVSVPNHKFEKYPFGIMTHFYYQVADENGQPTGEKVEIATTRLETLLGDEAIAIHSKDPRYTHLHGKRVYHPFRKITIPIICDDKLVDMNFGTGVVKVTPAHDPDDFECGMRNHLQFTNIFTDDGKINHICPEFEGMMRFDARIAIKKRMQEMGLFKEEKDHEMRLGISQRGHDVVEQMVTYQWFVDTKDMAARALKAVDDGSLKIVPEEFVIDWKRWHESIRPWCISRQLWWGHRIPAYHVFVDGKVQAGDKEWVAAHNQEEALRLATEKTGVDASHVKVVQDEDVLDTWFSSALLPFSALGWPHDTKDLATYFPNTILETGWDILTFWVSRMVMMSLELTDKVPFQTVLLHPLIRDAYGRKMSKSLGNVVDPLNVIRGVELDEMVANIQNATLDEKEKTTAINGVKEEYPHGIPQCGTDAMRMALCSFAGGSRTANLNVNVIVSYRNFCNKMWNAVKFSMPAFEKFQPSKISITNPSTIDRWILKRLCIAIRAATSGLVEYKMGDAVNAMTHFFHEEFCSVYLEAIKPILYSDKPEAAEAKATVTAVLYEVIETSMRMFHPYMPFVTEDLWQRIPKRFESETIMFAPYPTPNPEWEQFDPSNVDTANVISNAVRHIKTVYNIKEETMALHVVTANQQLESVCSVISALAGVGQTTLVAPGTPIQPGFVPEVISDSLEIRLDLKGLLDFNKELEKAQAKRDQLATSASKLEERMNLPTYAKVPENVKASDKEKLDTFKGQIAAIDETIKSLKRLLN